MGGGRRAQCGVENHSQRLAFGFRQTDVQVGVIGQQGSNAGQDRRSARPQSLHILTRGLAGQPSTFAGGQRGAPVQAHRQLGADKGATLRHALNKTGVQRPRLGFQQPAIHDHAGIPQLLQTLAGHLRVRIGHRRHHPADAGVEQRVGAGRGAAVMATRFQGHIGGGAARPVAGRFQGDHLGVGLAGAFVPTLADDHAVIDQHAADPWVGIGAVQAAPGQRQGPCHVAIIVGGHHSGSAVPEGACSRSISSRKAFTSSKLR